MEPSISTSWVDTIREASQNPGWRSVCGGLCIHLVLGTLYVWGIVTTAVTAHLRKYDPSLTYNDTLMVYATALLFQGLTMFLGGYLESIFGARVTCLLGGYILVLGTILSASVVSFPSLIFTYGVMFGIGIGVCYTGPMVCCSRWMPDKKGLVSGIIVGGFGGGACGFGLIASSVLQWTSSARHDSLDSDGYYSANSAIANSVPALFFVLGTTYFGLISLGAYLLVDNNNETSSNSISVRSQYRTMSTVEMVDASENSDKSFETDTQMQTGSSQSKGPSEVVRDPLGWHIASCFALTALGGMFIAGTYKTYGQQYLVGKVDNVEAFLSRVGSIGSIFNAGGRIVWGAISDRIGPIKTLLILSFFFSCLLATYSTSVSIGGGVGFALWTFAILFFEGGNFALYLPVTIQIFGVAQAGSNYGLIFTFYSFANVLNIAAVAKQDLNFFQATMWMAFLTICGCVNLMALRWHMNKRGIA